MAEIRGWLIVYLCVAVLAVSVALGYTSLADSRDAVGDSSGSGKPAMIAVCDSLAEYYDQNDLVAWYDHVGSTCHGEIQLSKKGHTLELWSIRLDEDAIWYLRAREGK